MDRCPALAAEARIIEHFSLTFGALHPIFPFTLPEKEYQFVWI
jgi:hypothetical protein